MTLTPQLLRAKRTQARLSLRHVARQTGICAQHLLDLERGFRNLSPALGSKLLKAMKQKSGSPRPGLEKVATFKKNFPHEIHSNEWKVKWPIQHANGKTYNPDFFSPALGCYIEVCTSWPNYSSDREKWRAALEAGYKLRVYWWEGQEITSDVRAGMMPSDLRHKHGISRA